MIKDCDRKGESHFEIKQENNPVSPGKVTVVFEFATKLGRSRNTVVYLGRDCEGQRRG
jgi:hypothetical protein